eukprot:366264-Chlamydomonas_euryale.AAC.4
MARVGNIVEESELGEGRAGAILMFGRVGLKAAAMTCARGYGAMGRRATGGTRLATEDDRVCSLDRESLKIVSWPG